GIRDFHVTGVQTCALPIFTEPKRVREALTAAHERFMTVLEGLDDAISVVADTPAGLELLFANRTYRRLFGSQPNGHSELMGGRRSEERRAGAGWRWGGQRS